MKQLSLSFLILLALLNNGLCQSGTKNKENALTDYVGNYYIKTDPAIRFVIRQEKENLIIDIVGQGQTQLTKIGKDRFSLKGVKPKLVMEFKRDSAGKAIQLKLLQPVAAYSLTRIKPSYADSSIHQPKGNLSKYIGDYQMTVNRNEIVHIREENGRLTGQNNGEGKLILTALSDNKFILADGDLRMVYEFIPDAEGKISSISFSRTGSIECIKTDKNFELPVVYGFNRVNGFTRIDSLRGQLTPLRTCYDVLFYDLDVSVDPSTKTVRGNNKIRFKAVQPFNQMQVDLFANMGIEKILFQNTSLSLTRELNAVFIQFPKTITEGMVEEINIFYAGTPQTPDPASMAGGIFWLNDKEGHDWIETVTQGSGASLWWPCKDHLSDKPDSMKISVTVPRGLTDISNGRLLRKTELPDNRTRFDWYVSYPITNYCVVMNIGNYSHFSDVYVSDRDTLQLNYYCMPYDVNIAQKIFKHTKPMLSVFEKDFGKYPFWRDGFTVMESIYPMEHQSAVSIGSIFSPFNSDTYDSLDLIRLMWHESAHEWWGNSVTVKDMADLWIHEAFATYAEVLAYENLSGHESMVAYLKEQKPGNKEAMIGQYDVNDFRLGDIYSKGALMLHTLRNLIDNDSLWFGLLRGIQTHFAYQTITTQELVNYINEKTKTDYRYFFDQYLTQPAVPELQLKLKREGTTTDVKYRWNAEAEGFRMPVKVTTAKDVYTFIYPTKDWQQLELKDMKPKEFNVDRDKFYVAVKKE